MSLKAFHIFFVTVSTLLCAGFGVWAIRAFSDSHETGLGVAAGFSLVACVVLVVYGRWFLRRLKGVSYL